MARSRRSRRSNDTGPGRGSFGAASFAVRPTLVRPRITPRIVLEPIEDRRRHHPLGYYRPARQVSGHPVRPLVVGGAPARSSSARPARGARPNVVRRAPSISPTVRFDVPKRTIICIRRKRRREVIMALGKGGGRHRRPKRNYFSEVKCR